MAPSTPTNAIVNEVSHRRLLSVSRRGDRVANKTSHRNPSYALVLLPEWIERWRAALTQERFPDYRGVSEALVYKDLRFSFDGNRYCVSARYAGEKLIVKAGAFSVV